MPELPPAVRLLAYCAILTYLMIITASMLRSKGSLSLAFGNRGDMPEPTPMAARADRAAKNMLENMVLFVAVAVATIGAADHDRVTLGARLFFWARLAYFPVYVFGITYLRTALWAVGIAGMGVMLSAVL
jgi:uncharacterized MAPEG superfamily protein